MPVAGQEASSYAVLDDERGFGLVATLFVMLMLVGLTAAGMHMSQASVATSRNYRNGTQAFYAAEAGVRHAVGLINETGVVNLSTDVINAWPGGEAPFGNGANTVAGGAFEYTVSILPDPFSADANRALLVSTGRGRDESARTVSARIMRGGIGTAPPGAVYIATDAALDATFNGNAFVVDGNDRHYGTPGPNPPVPGISTRLEENAREVRDALNTQQRDNVLGLGYVDDPLTPSVATSRGLSEAQIAALIEQLLALPHVVLSDSQIVGNTTFGTAAAPQITYFENTGGTTIRAAGAATGVGILIVEHALAIQGDLDFQGLILVRGETRLSGNATIHGSIWTRGLDLAAGGSALVQYSSHALTLAAQSGDGGAGGLRAPVVITGWRDRF